MREAIREAGQEGRDGGDRIRFTRLARVPGRGTAFDSRSSMSGGVDCQGLEVPRRIFRGGAKRSNWRVPHDPVATDVGETGMPDRTDVVYEGEFKGTGERRFILSRDISKTQEAAHFPDASTSPKSGGRRMAVVGPGGSVTGGAGCSPHRNSPLMSPHSTPPQRLVNELAHRTNQRILVAAVLRSHSEKEKQYRVERWRRALAVRPLR